MHLNSGPDTLRVTNGVMAPPAFERRALISAFHEPLEGHVDEFVQRHESSTTVIELPQEATCYLVQHPSWGQLRCAVIDVPTETPWTTHQFRLVDRVGMLFCVGGQMGVSLDERDPSSVSYQLKPEGGAVMISVDSTFRLFGPGSALFVFQDLSDKGKTVTEQINSLLLPRF